MTFIYGLTGKTCMSCAANMIETLPAKSLLDNPALLLV